MHQPIVANKPLQPVATTNPHPDRNHATHLTTTVLWPFFRHHLGEPVPEENFGLYGARED